MNVVSLCLSPARTKRWGANGSCAPCAVCAKGGQSRAGPRNSTRSLRHPPREVAEMGPKLAHLAALEEELAGFRRDQAERDREYAEAQAYLQAQVRRRGAV